GGGGQVARRRGGDGRRRGRNVRRAGIAGAVGRGRVEAVGSARRRAPPRVRGRVGGGLGAPSPVDAVGRDIELEAVFVRGPVRPGQVDVVAADGGGNQIARRRGRREGRHGDDVGGKRLAGRVIGADVQAVGGARRSAPPGVRRHVRAGL